MNGAQFRKALELCGLDQPQQTAADTLGVSLRTIQRWLSDELPVPRSIVEGLAQRIVRGYTQAQIDVAVSELLRRVS